jgi:DNA-binding transcriptional LysR family regulator
MYFKGLDLNLLVVLDALLQEKNATRTGERLGLSQSAVSGVLARLREYFNDDLLVQVGRHFVLTPLAESLVQPVRSLLQQVEVAIATKAQFDPATSTRQFTIMSSDYAMTVLLTKALVRIRDEAPGITIVLRQTTNSWQEELQRGAIDFVMIPEAFTLDSLPQTLLFQDDFTCVVWEQNTLVGDTLSVAQYQQLGHIGMAFGPTLNPSIEQHLLQQSGIQRHVQVIAPTFSLLPLLVVGTNQVATMHTRLAQLAATYLPLRLLPPPIALPRMNEMLQWPAHHTEEPGSQWLRNILQVVAANL